MVLDQKYASMLRPYVRNFTKKNNVFNFSCPYCGDSKKITSRARGYLFPGKNDNLLYKCHNCSAPAGFGSLLKEVDNNLSSEYGKDRFLEGKSERPAVEPAFAPPKFKKSVDKALTKISALKPDHFAKQYVMNRGIPPAQHHKLFYIRNFKVWANTVRAESFAEPIKKDEPRLIIPLIDKQHQVVGYQGRAFESDHPLKYITILVDERALKMFGLDTVNINQTVRAFEGPIDAMFIPNAVATTGGRQDTLLQQAGIGKDRTVLVYDNEPRNIHTIEKMEKGLASGWKVCIWPNNIKETDINAMVQAGYSVDYLTNIIDANTHQGLIGTLALGAWRKV